MVITTRATTTTKHEKKNDLLQNIGEENFTSPSTIPLPNDADQCKTNTGVNIKYMYILNKNFQRFTCDLK